MKFLSFVTLKFLSFVTLLLSISVGSAIQDDDAQATGNGGGDIDDGGHTHTIADYPSGCYDGPGPAQGHSFQFLDETAVCFYIRKGFNSNGRFQESAGVIFSTNAPGRVGEKAKVQLNVEDLVPPLPQGQVRVETSGYAFVGIAFDHGNYTWTIALGTRTYVGTDDGVTVDIPTSTEGQVSGGQRGFADYPDLTTTGRDGVKPTRDGMRLVSSAKSRDDSPISFEVRQGVFIERNISGTAGWQFQVFHDVIYKKGGESRIFDGKRLGWGYLNGGCEEHLVYSVPTAESLS